MNSKQQAETRTQVFCLHIQDYIRNTSVTWESYGQNVAEIYCRAVPPEFRCMEFTLVGDSFRQMKNNGQLVKRSLDGTTRLPVDLEESLLFALPPARMEALRAELAGRFGLLPVPKLSGATLADRTVSVGKLAKESGEALKAMGELLAADVPGPQHQEALAAAVKEVGEMAAMAVSVREMLEGQLDLAKGQNTFLRRAG